MELRKLVTVAAWLSAISGAAPAADLISNGSFESGLTGWTLFTSGVGVAVSNTNDAFAGTNAVRVTGRLNLTDGVVQNVLGALTAGGTGVTYTCRFSIRNDDWMSARAKLLVIDSVSTQRFILAEKMVFTTGAWSRVQGSQKVSWKGTATLARVSFEVAQIRETLFPSFTLDDVTVRPDADGDKLMDDEETNGTSIVSRDSDGDGMWDGWEAVNQLEPTNSTDGAADEDGDGFSNAQEFFAATQATNAASYPGRPANPHCSGPARAVLRDLALLPSRTNGTFMIGHHIVAPPGEFQQYIADLETLSGRWPAILSLQYEDFWPSVFQISNVNAQALSFWTNGGLLQMKWNPNNPWNGAQFGNTNLVDFPNLLNPTSVAHAVLTNWLGTVADGLEELRAAGVVVLWRMCEEMNGGWFWWGRKTRDEYVGYIRFCRDFLVNDRGLDNLLWVYESDSSVHDGTPADYYYPGDDYIDVIGHNLYDDDWVLTFDENEVFRSYPKVVAVPQAGPGPGLRHNGLFDNMIYVRAVTSYYPRCSYISAWNSFTNATTQTLYAVIHNLNATSFMNNASAVTRDELAWRDDSDGDGLPDWWEQQTMSSLVYSNEDLDDDGLLNADEFFAFSDPESADTDGDGLDDQSEILADTSAIDADSALAITEISETGGNVRVAWRGGRRTPQTISSASGLGSPWNDSVSIAAPTPRTNSVVLPIGTRAVITVRGN